MQTPDVFGESYGLRFVLVHQIETALLAQPDEQLLHLQVHPGLASLAPSANARIVKRNVCGA